MRITLNLNHKMLAEASRLTGIKEKTALINLGLKALISRESAKKLAALGGSEKHLKAVTRRRL